MVVIKPVFFHDLTFMVGGRFDTHLIDGGYFTDIKPVNKTVGDRDLRTR